MSQSQRPVLEAMCPSLRCDRAGGDHIHANEAQKQLNVGGIILYLNKYDDNKLVNKDQYNKCSHKNLKRSDFQGTLNASEILNLYVSLMMRAICPVVLCSFFIILA